MAGLKSKAGALSIDDGGAWLCAACGEKGRLAIPQPLGVFVKKLNALLVLHGACDIAAPAAEDAEANRRGEA